MSTYVIGVSFSGALSGPVSTGRFELLRDALRHYADYHPLRAKSRYQLEHTLEMFELWLGRAAAVSDLCSENVNRWLCSLEPNYSQRTVAGHRSNLLTLWRDVADRGLADPPRRIRRIGKPEPMPQAWSVEELQALLKAASELKGCLTNGISRALYFETFIRTGYQSGLRRSDLWSLRKSEIRDGCIYIRQRKTGHVETWDLSEDLVAVLLSMPGIKPLAWPQAISKFDSWFRRIKTAAGITRGKNAHGLRVSGATDLKRNGASPEQIQQFLGHKNLESQRSYLDKSLAHVRKMKPTPLEKPPEST